MDAILEQFLSEARENLSFLDKNLKLLKDGDEEIINALFRAAHTLKGGAGLVGFNAVKEITHAAEDLLDAFRKGEIEYKDELLDVLYDAFDEVVELIDAAEEIGSVDVDVDEEKIEEIKNEIRSFLKKEEDTNLDINLTNLPLSNFFTFEQLKRVAQNLPLKTPKINKAFLENDNYYLIEMDLDVDTFKLGNDPIYLLTLFKNMPEIIAIKVRCDEVEKDPLEWVSYILFVVKSNLEELEDVFFNIIDEMRFSPYSIEAMFDCECESEEDLVEEFKNEILTLVSNENYDGLKEKLNAIIQILNPETKEGFILTLLKIVLDTNRFDTKEIVKIVLDKLGWRVETKAIETKEKEEKFDKKTIKNALNILNSQLKVLDLSKDSAVIERTKLLLKNVLSFLNINKEIDNLDSKEELKKFINKVIEELKSKEVESKEIEIKEIKKEVKTPKKENKPSTPKFVKIEQEKIDKLMDIVGEVMVMKNSLPYIANQLNKDNIETSRREILNKYEEISRTIEQLQDIIMGMRLLPLSYIFDRYPKMIRDLSKKLNKKVRYIEEGGDTKLDKTVIEKLADPMIHVIRNSLDHGLESEEERIKKGKNPEGMIKISAKSEGDKVFISVEDDGRGIDEEKVVQKALEKRLIDPEVVDKMTKKEKLELIFLPGLSTKEEVTELSGRGVGADAVKKIIEELGGKIHVYSEKDKGTKIVFELPLSVALTNTFHIKMKGVNYAIPMDYVVETEKITKDKIQTAVHKPFIKLRDEIIPVIIDKHLISDVKDEMPIIILKSKVKFALVVDELIGQISIVQKPLSPMLSSHPFITGTSLLGNGEVIFLIDPKRIIKD